LLTAAELEQIIVVLVAARNPLNIGAAARAMSNFGFPRLRVVNRYQLAFREAQSAVGAAELLHEAVEYANLSEAVADCSLVVGTTAVGSRQIEQPVHRLEAGSRLIRDHIGSGGMAALLFGSEKRGLSNNDLGYCHWLMRIPTRPEHISMNLGQAVAVCLYELVRTDAPLAAGASSSKEVAQATGAELARLEQALLEALHASGYVKPGAEAATEERTRRLIRRLQLNAEDAETWTGMLSKMFRTNR